MEEKGDAQVLLEEIAATLKEILTNVTAIKNEVQYKAPPSSYELADILLTSKDRQQGS